MNTSISDALFAGLPSNEQVPVTRNIAQHLRNLIHNGKLDPRNPLPSHRVLAVQFGIPASTVNMAIKSLVAEGLLMRRHGFGTFVKERPRALRTVALYYYGGALAHPDARYQNAVHRCLLNRLEAAGMNGEIWADSRPEEESRQAWPELAEACRCGKVDAVVTAHLPLSPRRAWLNRLSVPLAFAGPKPGNNRVIWADAQFHQLAFDSLVRHGCRSAGLISMWPARRRRNKSSDEKFSLFDGFQAEVRRRKLKTADSWVVTPDRMAKTAGMSAEEWGYRAFLRLWSQKEHPEGLIVITDAEALGVTMAIMELGIKVPENLRLVYHKNAEINLFCPFPVTHIVDKADDIAAALLDLVQRQFDGKRVKPVLVEYTIQESSGQSADSDCAGQKMQIRKEMA